MTGEVDPFGMREALQPDAERILMPEVGHPVAAWAFDEAVRLLETHGVNPNRFSMGRQKMLVTSQAVPYKLAHATMYNRLLAYPKKDGTIDSVNIVFDPSSDKRINPDRFSPISLIRLGRLDSDSAVKLFVHTNDQDLRTNDEEDLRVVKEILEELGENYTQTKKNRTKNVKIAALATGALSTLGGAGAGTVWGAATVLESSTRSQAEKAADYDLQDIELTEGTIIRLGETKSPVYSDLLEQEIFATDTVPELTEEGESTGGFRKSGGLGGNSPDDPQSLEHPRGIDFHTYDDLTWDEDNFTGSGEEDKNDCESYFIDFGDRLPAVRVATDYLDSDKPEDDDGNDIDDLEARHKFSADQIQVTVEEDIVRACWIPEDQSMGRPRIVIQAVDYTSEDPVTSNQR